jgi:hypothetical protein
MPTTQASAASADPKQHLTGSESFILEVASAMTATLASKARRVFSHTRLSIALQGVLAAAALAWRNASAVIAAWVIVMALLRARHAIHSGDALLVFLALPSISIVGLAARRGW